MKGIANKNKKFYKIIQSEIKVPKPIVNNIAEMIFKKLPHRDEESETIYTHHEDELIKINLNEYRFIISKLYEEFQEKNICPDDSCLLVDLSSNSPLFISLMFSALTSYGVRTLLPLFVETSDLNEWIKKTNCKFVILPENEIKNLKDHDIEKKVINNIRIISEKNNIKILDITKDFQIKNYLNSKEKKIQSFESNQLVQKAIKNTNINTESVIFTTSGSTGKSKLVIYEQGSFIKNCTCWQAGGMYNKNMLGGKSFIDIFTHTITVRAFFNAIWTGYPICIINKDLITQKPEKIFPFFISMKPQNMSLGPSSYNFLMEFIKLAPEIKNLAFNELRTVVSTGATYDKDVAQKIKDSLGVYLHNSFGTTETQQVLTTILCKKKDDFNNISLGKPIAGVKIGLEKYSKDLYKMYVKSPFGFKKIIDEKINDADGFYDTKDIVKLGSDNQIIYVGRENIDFFKSGYGAKIPINHIKKYYEELYEIVYHIEYFQAGTMNFLFGLYSLIFINEPNIPPGRVTDKKTIKKYYEKISKINDSLKNKLEPFEYDFRTISRFMLMNEEVTTTFKGTISRYIIESTYSKEINDLRFSKKRNIGIVNLKGFENGKINFIFKYTPVRIKKIRSFLINYLSSNK